MAKISSLTFAACLFLGSLGMALAAGDGGGSSGGGSSGGGSSGGGSTGGGSTGGSGGTVKKTCKKGEVIKMGKRTAEREDLRQGKCRHYSRR